MPVRGCCTFCFLYVKNFFYANIENVYVDFNTPYLLKKQKRYYLCTEEIYFFTNLTK